MSGTPRFEAIVEREGAILPVRSSAFAAGYDLFACLDEPVIVKAKKAAVLVPTGVKIHIADPGIVGIVYPRSGMGHKQGFRLGNTCGVIDPDYQGEWMISCFASDKDIVINHGDKIAQVVFMPILHPEFESVEKFKTDSVRGSGGFGSTGKK